MGRYIAICIGLFLPFFSVGAEEERSSFNSQSVLLESLSHDPRNLYEMVDGETIDLVWVCSECTYMNMWYVPLCIKCSTARPS